jgi:hypothetical protein
MAFPTRSVVVSAASRRVSQLRRRVYGLTVSNWARRLLATQAIVVALIPCGVLHAGLLTNFQESYALYEACLMSPADSNADGDVDGDDFLRWQANMGLTNQTDISLGDADRNTVVDIPDHDIWKYKFGHTGGLPASVCFKLFLEPEGIISGEVTAFVDSPHPGIGDPRFMEGAFNGITNEHPGYAVQVLNEVVVPLPGRQRIETTIRFDARNPLDPPAGPLTIFGYQFHDMLPQLGLEGVQTGFSFRPGNFITTYDPVNDLTQTFTPPQLTDVHMPLNAPLLQPTDLFRTIDVDPPSSRSAYPAGQPSANALDSIATTQYANLGERNAGFVTAQGAPSFGAPVRSIVFTSGMGDPAGDPTTWELYGTNVPVASPDNSDGNLEPWTLISSGVVNLPLSRGAAGPPVSFVNGTIYSDYRIVFPTIRDFRAANSMQIGEVTMFTLPLGMGNNVSQFLATVPPRAIHLPTLGADSPPQEGAEKVADGDVHSKYRNFGKENSGFIVAPAVGATTVNAFIITTASDFPERDPASWILYGTNDPIASPDFSDGNLENWQFIASGNLSLPGNRLATSVPILFENATQYQAYRMVFPTLKDPTSPDADSIQIAEIQLYGSSGPPTLSVPEPKLLALLGVGITALASTPSASNSTFRGRGNRRRRSRLTC